VLLAGKLSSALQEVPSVHSVADAWLQAGLLFGVFKEDLFFLFQEIIFFLVYLKVLPDHIAVLTPVCAATLHQFTLHVVAFCIGTLIA